MPASVLLLLGLAALLDRDFWLGVAFLLIALATEILR